MSRTCFVTGMPRTATTVFVEALKQNPELMAAGELFSLAAETDRQYFHDGGGFSGRCWNPGDDTARYLNRLQGEAEQSGRRCLFKWLDIHDRAVLGWLRARAARMILLRRDNPLECLVSEIYAKETKSWHCYGPKHIEEARQRIAERGPITVDPLDVLRWVHRDEALFHRAMKWPGPVLVLSYSHLQWLFEEAVADTFDWLGVQRAEVTIKQRKIADRPVWERVANYGALAAQFKGTIAARCFPTP